MCVSFVGIYQTFRKAVEQGVIVINETSCVQHIKYIKVDGKTTTSSGSANLSKELTATTMENGILTLNINTRTLSSFLTYQ